MAKFKYVGDPNDGFSGPQTIQMYGQTFVKGETVTVDDKATTKYPNGTEMSVVEKLQGNSHFVDMSDKEGVQEVDARQKATADAEKAQAKADKEQRKRDEADEKQRQDNLAKATAKRGPGRPRRTAATAPRPPGKVTRPPVADPFQGRTVEERTRAEDHTSAGKTKS